MAEKKWSTIKGSLKDVSRAGLLGLVTDLYKLNAENKRFLHTRFDENLDPLKEYKGHRQVNLCWRQRGLCPKF